MRLRCISIALCICLFAFPLVLVADDYYIQWADTIDNGDWDGAFGVTVDNSNNIIVTGCSFIGGNNDYFTVKYDSNGTILWQDTLDNGEEDLAEAVAVDNANNIIMTGYCDIGGDYDYFTVKYDSNGIISWVDTIDNNGLYDIARGVAVDNSNNIIVTGYCDIGSDCVYFTVKYNSNGTILWQDTLDDGPFDSAFGVAVDNSNNIIVTGSSVEPFSDYDYFTVKYDSNGTILWQDTLDNGNDDIAHGVAVDDFNNIIVTGKSYIGGNFDYFTVKYVPFTGISEKDVVGNVASVILYDISPNPTVGEALKITYCLTSANDVTIKVYNSSGSLVRVLENKPKASGYYTIIWDGTDYGGKTVSSGVYFLKFETGDYNETKKILFIK
ncbi:MAG: FlgD immunoglobulin-like domain containing protein [bacterium]